MPRKPTDNVAANKTITIRLTPNDRDRVDRIMAARAAELPERSLSALLRRLVRDADDGTMVRIRAEEHATMVRLPAEERALLDRLVAARAEELARLGVDEANVTPESVVVRLIREAARAKGITAPAAPQAAEAPSQPAGSPAPTEAPGAPKPAACDPARVKAALLAALERGVSQARLAREAGLDSGHLSRFKAKGSGLSPESLAKLSKALESCS